MSTQVEVGRVDTYRKVLRNRTLWLLWSGGTISSIGDAFFNLAVAWVIYTSSHSVLQTSFIQVVGHLDRILFGTIAGVLADRWDRKRIMVITNLIQAFIVGGLAAQMSLSGHISRIAMFVTVFLLSTFATFFQPSSNAIIPEVVGHDALVTAQGLLSTAGYISSFVGQALAGVVVAAFGAVWSVFGDAVSFLVPAICIGIAKFPKREQPSTPFDSAGKRPSFIREIVAGWKAISNRPVVKAMVWLGVLINVTSFISPLVPGLIQVRLHSGAAAMGALGAADIVGAAVGGLVAGFIERKLGAGRVFVLGCALGGITIIGMAASTWLPLTLLLSAIGAVGLTIGIVSMGAVVQALVPEEFRGRVWGISSSIGVALIPLSSLLAGWLADIFGPAPLFAAGGFWLMGVALVAWGNRHVRTARI